MTRKTTVAVLIVSMAVVSAALFLLQYILFHRPGDSEFTLFQDLAFLPINVLLVTVGLDTFISYREKRDKLDKINLLICEFFAESGINLIRLLNAFVVNIEEINAYTVKNELSSNADLKQFVRNLDRLQLEFDARHGNLDELRSKLAELKPALLSMFENPNLIEHDRFTDMLWSIYHLMDELRSRDSLDGLPASDMKHLSNDIRRAYSLLVVEWATIMRHMKEKYPYLYSMANRKNPFMDKDIVIRE